jgi:DNA-binding transcriptional LysR family regulator
MERLAGMAIFARVVEEESFSRAAIELGLSKSTVSKSVQELEGRLGAQLLSRTTRRLNLTEVGREFYARCQKVVLEAAAAEDAVAEFSVAPRGTLRVMASVALGDGHLAPLAPEFLDRYPTINLEFSFRDEPADVVDTGFDLAIRIGPSPIASFVSQHVAPCRYVVCGSPEYFARFGMPRTPRDLLRHSCLQHIPTGDVWRFDGPKGKSSVRIKGRFRANTGEALRRAAVAGHGLLYAPTYDVRHDLRHGRLVAALADHIPDSAIYAVYPRHRHLSIKVRVFLDFLVQRLTAERDLEAD